MIHKSYKAIDNLRIIITKAEPSCVFCGSTENLMPCKGKYLCRDCAKDISK